MPEDITLVEKREEIKHHLASGRYRTLFDPILAGTSRLIQKLTSNSNEIPIWYGAIVISLVTVLIGLWTSVLLGEFYPLRRRLIIFEVLAIIGLPLYWLAFKTYMQAFFTTLRDHIVDAIEGMADLADLEHWLTHFGNLRKPFFFSLAWGMLMGGFGFILLSVASGSFHGFGFALFFALATFQAGISLFYIFIFLGLPMRVSRYQFKLYPANPGNSEVIDHLSELLTNFVYLIAVFAALVTVALAFLGVLTIPSIIFLILVAWGPLTILFIINQYALRKIITRAKWKKLNEIQAKIERLEAEEDIPTKDTITHIRALIDYHDHISATRNSALDLRAGLNFLNSLLLPLFAFLLANLDKVIAFF